MAYKLALFVHVIAVITLFGAVTVEHVVGVRLRKAGLIEEVRSMIATTELAVKIIPPSAIVILLSGGYMTHLSWSFSTPWIVLGLVLLVAAAAVGGGVTAKRLRKLGELSAKGNGPIDATLSAAAKSPALWVPSFAGVGIGLSILFEMTVKPDWMEAIAVPVIAIAITAILGLQAARAASLSQSAVAPATRSA